MWSLPADQLFKLSSSLNYLSIQRNFALDKFRKKTDRASELDQSETLTRLRKLEEKIEQDKKQTERDSARMRKELAQLKKEKREREQSERISVKVKPEEKEKAIATREITKKIQGSTGTSSSLLKPFVKAGVEAGYKKYGALKPEIKQAQKIAGKLYQATYGAEKESISASGELSELETNTFAKLSRKARCFANPLTYSVTGTEPSNTTVGFSFYNKSTRSVSITVKNNKLKKKQITAKIPAGYIFDLPLEIATQTGLAVTDGNKTSNYRLPAHKTIYVTWGIPEAEKLARTTPYLYPQSGPAGGLLKTTEHCYALSKNNKDTNVSLDDLEPKKPSAPAPQKTKKAQAQAKTVTKQKPKASTARSSKQLVRV